jgi:hypothetical protein
LILCIKGTDQPPITLCCTLDLHPWVLHRPYCYQHGTTISYRRTDDGGLQGICRGNLIAATLLISLHVRWLCSPGCLNPSLLLLWHLPLEQLRHHRIALIHGEFPASYPPADYLIPPSAHRASRDHTNRFVRKNSQEYHLQSSVITLTAQNQSYTAPATFPHQSLVPTDPRSAGDSVLPCGSRSAVVPLKIGDNGLLKRGCYTNHWLRAEWRAWPEDRFKSASIGVWLPSAGLFPWWGAGKPGRNDHEAIAQRPKGGGLKVGARQ